MSCRRILLLVIVVSLAGFFASPRTSTSQTVSPQQEVLGNINVGVVRPAEPGEFAAAAPVLSPADREALIERYQARREARDAANAALPIASGPTTESAPGIETAVAQPASLDTEFHSPPTASALVIGRNSRNLRANSALGSTLAEPVAVNEGIRVLYAGNTHAEFSTDGGATFPAANNIPLPAGPATAPIACCDPDAIYDQARGVTFWSMLYVNAALTQGTVRIFVRRQIQLANNCFYDITPGSPNVPDYPHLGLSNDFLYLTVNNNANHQVRRFDINAMADCAAVPFSTFTLAPAVGRRVVVPVDGARETMYWAYLENATQIRIFAWPEAGGVSNVLRNIATHNHANPDCRGGANNTDWIERSTAFSITGFRMRGAVGRDRVGWEWNVSADAAAGHNQAHVHAAVFSTSALSLIAQPHIFNSTFCYGYPMVAANERGDIGLAITAGGRAGGGGPPVRGYVGIDDDFTPGIWTFGTVFLVANGTHNPVGAPPRWGDYVTVRSHEPCDFAFVATHYAHNGGTGLANINARYVEFLRGRDNQCYVGWRNEDRIP
jgi:hypothetical protein